MYNMHSILRYKVLYYNNGVAQLSQVLYTIFMTVKQFLFIVEIRTKIVSVSTFLLALSYTLWTTGSVPLHLVILTFIAALFVDMGTTGFNSYFDWYHNVDDPKFNKEDAKVIIHEGVSPGSALIASIACWMVAFVPGVIITVMRGLPVIAIGAVCLLVGFFYSAGKRPISFTPWGEFFAGGFLGTVFFVLCNYIFTGTFSEKAFLVSLPQSFSIAAILSTNNACDFDGDKAAGRKTLAILAGKKLSPYIIYTLEFLWLISLFMLTAFKYLLGIVLPLATIVAVIVSHELYSMHIRGYTHATKGPNMGSISKIFLLETAGILASFALDFFVFRS